MVSHDLYNCINHITETQYQLIFLHLLIILQAAPRQKPAELLQNK
jgi:hypothetical protein